VTVIARIVPCAVVVAVVVIGVPAITAQTLADAPSHREALMLFRTGQELMSEEKFERAAAVFSSAIAKDALLTVAHYGLGQAYMNLRRFEDAAEAYKRCIEATRALYTLQQTNQFEVEKQRDDEIRELRTILDRAKGARMPTVLSLEQRLRDLENQRSSMGGPFRPPAEMLLALGSAYFRNGDREEAELEWRAAIDANPKLGEAHNNIAVIYMQTDRLDQALEEVTLAEKAGFKVNPQFKADLRDKIKAAKR
jgi:tetratricopeptide (TPR) repeat protein